MVDKQHLRRSVFCIAFIGKWELLLIFLFLFPFFLDCSCGFGGLSWWWRWRGRRWGGAVSKEAGPPELLGRWALNCPLFGRGGRTLSPSHPPSSGRLIGPWPSCATCQSHWGDRQRWAPTSLSPLPIPAPLFSLGGRRWRASLMKECSVCSFSLSVLLLRFPIILL